MSTELLTCVGLTVAGNTVRINDVLKDCSKLVGHVVSGRSLTGVNHIQYRCHTRTTPLLTHNQTPVIFQFRLILVFNSSFQLINFSFNSNLVLTAILVLVSIQFYENNFSCSCSFCTKWCVHETQWIAVPRSIFHLILSWHVNPSPSKCIGIFKKNSVIDHLHQKTSKLKGKGKGKEGAYSSSWNSPQNYGTPLVKWDHTVLSATRQKWPPRLHPNRAGWYSIYRPRKDERLSWPSWLVTYRNGLPVHRQSPIRVLTGSDVAQLRWSKPTCYH